MLIHAIKYTVKVSKHSTRCTIYLVEANSLSETNSQTVIILLTLSDTDYKCHFLVFIYFPNDCVKLIPKKNSYSSKTHINLSQSIKE